MTHIPYSMKPKGIHVKTSSLTQNLLSEMKLLQAHRPHFFTLSYCCMLLPVMVLGDLISISQATETKP